MERMEIFDRTAIEEEVYPFADLSRLRMDAGAFMHRVLSEDQDFDLQEDCDHHVITPEDACFTSSRCS